jgi:hypothetical protein
MNKTEYLLTCLAEECAEVGQRASKAIRFGLDETQPGQDKSNAMRMLLELMDVMAVFEMLIEQVPAYAEIDTEALYEQHKEQKLKALTAMMQYSVKCGCLQETKWNS